VVFLSIENSAQHVSTCSLPASYTFVDAGQATNIGKENGTRMVMMMMIFHDKSSSS